MCSLDCEHESFGCVLDFKFGRFESLGQEKNWISYFLEIIRLPSKTNNIGFLFYLITFTGPTMKEINFQLLPCNTQFFLKHNSLSWKLGGNFCQSSVWSRAIPENLISSLIVGPKLT